MLSFLQSKIVNTGFFANDRCEKCNERKFFTGKAITHLYLHSDTRYHPDNLLHCHRVHDPGQYEAGHCREHGPEHFSYVLIFPERFYHRTGT